MKCSTFINYFKLTVKPALQLQLLASSKISSSQPRLSSSFLGDKKKKFLSGDMTDLTLLPLTISPAAKNILSWEQRKLVQQGSILLKLQEMETSAHESSATQVRCNPEKCFPLP